MTVGSLERLVQALDADLVVEIRWRGAQLDGLVDRAHASLVTATARRLEGAGWVTRAEVSFNHFGDRGRCDLVAWHPARRVLMVVEAKSRFGDLQDTLGRLDVKVRLGAIIGEQLGFAPPQLVIPALVAVEHGANRRILLRHEVLFRQYGVRGRAALAWIRRPTTTVGGLLWFESPDSDQSRTKRPGSRPRRPPAG